MARRTRPRDRGLYADRRTWINNGRAWVNPATEYPRSWSVLIPRGRQDCTGYEVSSLEEALQVAADHGVELTVSERTYPYLVEQGFCPAERPDTVPFATAGETDLMDLDGIMDVQRRTADLLGLPAAVAAKLVHERGLTVRTITPETEYVDCALHLSRINLRINASGTVIHVSQG